MGFFNFSWVKHVLKVLKYQPDPSPEILHSLTVNHNTLPRFILWWDSPVSGRVMWEELVWPSVDWPPVDWPRAEERLGWAWAPWIFIYQVLYNQKMVPMNCFSALLHTHHTPWVELNFMIVKAWVINIKSLYLRAATRPWTPRARVTLSTHLGTFPASPSPSALLPSLSTWWCVWHIICK